MAGSKRVGGVVSFLRHQIFRREIVVCELEIVFLSFIKTRNNNFLFAELAAGEPQQREGQLLRAQLRSRQRRRPLRRRRVDASAEV